MAWDDENTPNEEEKKKGLNNIIEEVVKYRKSIDKDFYDDNFRDKLKFTCLRNIDDLEKLDGIRKANILCGNKLKQEIYEIILESITKEKEAVRDEITNKMKSFIKPAFKRIKLECDDFEKKLIVTNNKESCKEKENGVEIYDNFKQLVIKFQRLLPNPIFKEKNNARAIMTSINDFLASEEHVFEAIEGN